MCSSSFPLPVARYSHFPAVFPSFYPVGCCVSIAKLWVWNRKSFNHPCAGCAVLQLVVCRSTPRKLPVASWSWSWSCNFNAQQHRSKLNSFQGAAIKCLKCFLICTGLTQIMLHRAVLDPNLPSSRYVDREIWPAAGTASISPIDWLIRRT